MKAKHLIPLFFSCSLLIGCSGGKKASSSKDGSTGGKKEGEKEKEKARISANEKQKEKILNTDLSKQLEKKFPPDSLKKKEEKAKPIQKDRPPFVLHKRTPCYGKCPIYTLRIWPDGTAKLKAGRYVKVDKGDYRGKVPESKIERIKTKAREIDFFQLKKNYDQKGVTDLPSRITELAYGNKEHRVRNRYEGPEKLKALEEIFAKIVENTRWKPLPSDDR
ncbi:MAG: DUF6438 domain-containing protein [Flavobacteriales bacterium]